MDAQQGTTSRPPPTAWRPTGPRRPGGLGVGIGVLAACLLVVGLASTAAGLAQGDDFFSTSSERLHTESAAMTTREIDVEARRPTDPQNDPGDLARVRLRVTPADPARPVFVGVARRADVQRYLAGTAHDEMATFETDPFRVDFRRHPGARAAAPPTEQDFWVAQSTGGRPFELEWDKSLGEWMVVAMNVDGSPGVDLRADVGLRFGFLLPVGLTALGASAALGAAVVLLRRQRTVA